MKIDIQEAVEKALKQSPRAEKMRRSTGSPFRGVAALQQAEINPGELAREPKGTREDFWKKEGRLTEAERQRD